MEKDEVEKRSKNLLHNKGMSKTYLFWLFFEFCEYNTIRNLYHKTLKYANYTTNIIMKFYGNN